MRDFVCLSEVSPDETQNPLTAVIIELDAMAAIKGLRHTHQHLYSTLRDYGHALQVLSL